MRYDEKQSLLPKKYSPSYFSIPVPPPRGNTVYSTWQFFDCTCIAVPIWQQSPFRSYRWLANTYDTCMQPAYFYDRLIYTICCCGKPTCCDCHCIPLSVAAIILNTPKIPCCILGGTFGCFSGMIGCLCDKFNPIIPPREQMPAEGSSIDQIEQNLGAKIDTWIRTNDLRAANDFFSKQENVTLLQISNLYEKKIFLICLAIRYPNNDIPLEDRKKFIRSLLDKNIIDGYSAYAIDSIPAPLLEAARSEYIHSDDLLEMLCEYGADTYSMMGNLFNRTFVPEIMYYDYLENSSQNLFYKMLLLKYYENKNEESYLYPKFEEHYAELDVMLEQLVEKGESRELRRAEIIAVLSLPNIAVEMIPMTLINLVLQYSALLSPMAFADSKSEYHRNAARLPSTSLLFTYYNPLPPVRRLSDARPDSSSRYLDVGVTS